MQSWRLRPISANLFKMFFVKLPQNRHPERSASQIDCVTQCLWRGVEEPVLSVAEGTSALLISPMPFGAFQPPRPHRADRRGLSLSPGTKNPATIQCVSQQILLSGSVVEKLRAAWVR